MSFRLDARLEADSTAVRPMALCDLRLMNDSRFPWLLLVPRRADAVELHELDAADRALLVEETASAARALLEATGPAKINVGALGNIVRQLHVHVVARRPGDAAWPGPVWGSGAAVPYAETRRQELLGLLRAALAAS